MADETTQTDGTTQPAAGGTDDAVKRAAFERDKAKAETLKLQKELEAMKAKLPTDDQIARWNDLDKAAEAAEEARKRKEGEFDQWRQQFQEKHVKAIEAKDKAIAEEQARVAALDKKYNDKLVALEFSSAVSLFGEKGKTVLLPEIAEAYFARNVEVQVDEKSGDRRVVVKDNQGVVKIDPKTGHPMEFGKAMAEVIEEHPQKNSLLRGSGNVGAGSAGGGNAGGQVDTRRLVAASFKDPKVREAVKKEMTVSGGLQSGRFFDKFAQK